MRTLLRAAHVLAVGALYGGSLYGVSEERLLPALLATIVTGLLFMSFEVWRAPICFVQVRGAANFFKLALLAMLPFFWDQRAWILSGIVVIATVVSHMPSKYRYFSLRHGRVMGGEAKG